METISLSKNSPKPQISNNLKLDFVSNLGLELGLFVGLTRLTTVDEGNERLDKVDGGDVGLDAAQNLIKINSKLYQQNTARSTKLSFNNLFRHP